MKKMSYIVAFFSLLMMFFIFDLQGNLQTYLKYRKYFKALYLGDKMKNENMVLRNCSDISIQEDLHKKFENIPKANISCLNKSKLIYIGPYYGDHAVATFRCFNDDLVVEYSWTDFQESCSIIVSKKSWNIPEKMTVEHLNSP